MQSHNLLLGSVTDELVGRGALMLKHGVVHGGELGFVDLQAVLAVLSLGLWLCEPDRANFWVREDYRWDVVVVQLSLCEFWPAKEAVGQAAAGGDGDCYVVSTYCEEVREGGRGGIYQASTQPFPKHPPTRKYSAHWCSGSHPRQHVPSRSSQFRLHSARGL